MFEKGRQSRASKMPGTMFLLVGALTNCRNAPIKKKQKFSRIWPLCRFSCLRFSPKSGRVFGPRQTNFILPSLRNDETRRRLQEPYNLHDPDEGVRPVDSELEHVGASPTSRATLLFTIQSTIFLWSCWKLCILAVWVQIVL